MDEYILLVRSAPDTQSAFLSLDTLSTRTSERPTVEIGETYVRKAKARDGTG